MVNQLRTLILNEVGSAGTRYDEYVPTEFQGVELTADEHRVRSRIFHPEAPRDYQEFVATALTRLVYGTPLGALYIDPIDSRSTLSNDKSLVNTLSPSITLETLYGSSLVDTFGTFTPDLERGIYSNAWVITAINSTTAFIDDERLQERRTVTLTFTDGASNEVRLEPRSALWFRLTNEPGSYPVVARVTARATPQVSVLLLLARFRQEGRIRPFITSMGISELVSAYDDQISPVNAVAAALCAYCLSISRRIAA